jgi:preprotein translocase subunit SecA
LNEAKRLFAEGNDDAKGGGMYLFRAFRGLPKYGPVIKYLSEPGVKVKMQKAENYYLQDQQRNMHIIDEELLFHIDEKNNSVDMTDKGLNMITRTGEDPDFFVLPDIGVKLADIEKRQFKC